MAQRKGHLSDQEFRKTVLQIAEQLDGLHYSQIQHVLHQVGQLCAQGSFFTTQSDSFVENYEIFRAGEDSSSSRH